MVKLKKKIEASVILTVMDGISRDRRQAHEALRKASLDLQAGIDTINQRDSEVVQELADALAEQRSLPRYEASMVRQEFDAYKREVEERLHDVQGRHSKAKREAQAELEPVQERLQTAQTRTQELAREWTTNLRLAKAANVDLSGLWTPENPVPLSPPSPPDIKEEAPPEV